MNDKKIKKILKKGIDILNTMCYNNDVLNQKSTKKCDRLMNGNSEKSITHAP